ncbi:hypothetical protein [Micromonospora chersina]|uniref:hypothetical protein n=1 Tax=Micromonospora chersina TaxID=47854 RepID=UPI00371B06A7
MARIVNVSAPDVNHVLPRRTYGSNTGGDQYTTYRKKERMRLPKKLRLPLAAIAGVSLVLAMGGSPAQAHIAIAYHGSDYASVSSGHTFVTVYDKEADNNGVYGVFYLYDGTTHQVGDPNGSASGGGSAGFSAGVDWFYVCERNVGCSGVVNA